MILLYAIYSMLGYSLVIYAGVSIGIFFLVTLYGGVYLVSNAVDPRGDPT